MWVPYNQYVVYFYTGWTCPNDSAPTLPDENQGLEDEFPFQKAYLKGLCEFWGR